MGDLPMVLITEVLSKLPVKSLLRFLCVCKSWQSLIKDPFFIKLHLKHSLETNTNQALIISDIYLHSIDFPNLNLVTIIEHPLKSGALLYGSCNGLLCLSNGDDEGTGTIFYNPATRKHHDLPASRIEFSENSMCSESVEYGFGYDGVNDDYKLVRISQFDGDGFGFGFDEYDGEVKVYSLKSGSWKRINDFPREYYVSYKGTWGFHVNGCLHWVVTRNPDSDGTELIIAFDIGSEEYKIVPQPENLDGDVRMTVGALKGCLCVSNNYFGLRIDIWIMEEYGVENSWTKLFSISNGGIMGSFVYVRPIAFSNDGLRVLVEKDGKCAFWFDLERQTVENVEVPDLPRLPALYDTELIVESLVPLECHQKKKKVKPKVKKELPKQKEHKSKQERPLNVLIDGPHQHAKTPHEIGGQSIPRTL